MTDGKDSIQNPYGFLESRGFGQRTVLETLISSIIPSIGCENGF